MFFAYPNKPNELALTIERAVSDINLSRKKITPWKALDIAGSFIADQIKDKIDEKETIVADISKLNFNVTFEVGYAIGQRKKVLLTKNRTIKEGDATIREVGIFDTIGYLEYENSVELAALLRNKVDRILYPEKAKINKKTPVYLLETKYKTDFSTRITARIKKARLNYRSFDPNEMPRLSALDAIDQISQSFGVVVSLLSSESEECTIHNIRASFIAGLATGMNKELLILQYGIDPVPIDYRDFVCSYNIPDDINKHIGEFANKITEAFQEDEEIEDNSKKSYLQALDLGSSSAENEMRTLRSYYLKTDQFLKAARGEAQMVVGRKGSGKSAIFLQIRDRERSKGRNVVLDLKPDGYKLIKLKEYVLEFLEEGTFQHTITAFWEYILLLEICHKILEGDKKRHCNQPELVNPYKELEELFSSSDYLTEGDFSERMSNLISELTINFKSNYNSKSKVRLSTPQVTSLIYKTDILKLRSKLTDYLRHKDVTWLLFDNIDKGWPSTGLKHEDLLIIRTLIDASRKIQRYFDKENIEINPLVFLRNDVYELLVEETSDRQKESIVLLDWTDPDLLRELIKLRIESNIDNGKSTFEKLWRNICVSHYDGEETSQYLIERSLMRPRFLINLINQCKGFAINLNHDKIEKEDIEKGIKAFSNDLLTDISYEIRDVLPEAENILYNFISSKPELSSEELCSLLDNSEIQNDLQKRIVDLLLWYGFIGVKIDTQDVKYIYNLNYNMRLLRGLIEQKRDDIVYVINPGFWPSLIMEK